MHFIYSALLGLGFLLLLPWFLRDALRHGKYISGLSERLGKLDKLDHSENPVIWVHCVSVGEVQAARPLAQAIHRAFPSYLLVVSTVTITGQQLAREVFKAESQRIFYLPLDWSWTVRRALKVINPSLVLIMETELWPGFLRECRRLQIPAAIVNGRLSEKSFRRYKLIPSFISHVVNCLDLAIMQTDADARRMSALGLRSDRVLVGGNMKFDAGVATEMNSLTDELATRFHLREASILLAASTHEPEEQIILEAFLKLRANPATNKLRLVIAPRHPERFAAVASLLTAANLVSARRTAAPADRDGNCEVLLLDTIGELRALFPLASVVFVGGSIAPTGGQNILEPAAAGCCIVTGPHTENFAEIVKTFTAKKAIIQLDSVSRNEAAAALAKIFANLMGNAGQREELGERAKALTEQNRGATARTMKMLKPLLINAAKASVADGTNAKP